MKSLSAISLFVRFLSRSSRTSSSLAVIPNRAASLGMSASDTAVLSARQQFAHSAATWLLVLLLPLFLFYFAWLGVREGNRELVLFVVGAFLVKLAMVIFLAKYMSMPSGLFLSKSPRTRASPAGAMRMTDGFFA